MRAILALAVLVFLVGCHTVSSVHPLYFPNEKTFDKTLLGEWVEVSDADAAQPGDVQEAPKDDGGRIEKGAVDGAPGYIIKDGDETLLARLVSIKGKRYIDVVILKKGEEDTKRHLFVKVSTASDSWAFQMMDYDVVKKYLKDHPKAVSYEISGSSDSEAITLTAKTRKLRKFVSSLESVPGAWDANDEARFRRPTK